VMRNMMEKKVAGDVALQMNKNFVKTSSGVVSRKLFLKQVIDTIPQLSYTSGGLHASRVFVKMSECRVLQVSAPRVTLCNSVLGDMQAILLHVALEERPTLALVLKRFNLLVFSSNNENVGDFFRDLVASIELKPTDCVNVYQLANRDFVVAWYKQDQRKVVFPPHFVFKTRYVFNGAMNDNVLFERVGSLISRIIESGKFDCVEMLHMRDSSQSHGDLVLAAKSLTPIELHMSRLEASLVPADERSPWQTAIISSAGWNSLMELTKADEKVELNTNLWYADAPVKDVPRPSGYKNFAITSYECFDIEWKYFDTVSGRDVLTTLTEIVEKAGGPMHFKDRSIVIMGSTRDGKTYLARALCRMFAMMAQRNLPQEKQKFLEINNHEFFKNPMIKAHAQEGVPILWDDLSPGKMMHPQAVPADFLKNLFDVKSSKMLHCRNFNAVPKAGSRVFTSNALNFEEFVQLADGKSLPIQHLNAVRARVVIGTVQSRLYTGEQNASINEDRAESFLEEKEALDAMKASGLL
jgi:hypothetical protein